jgi:Mrp family chromosome partitioning ATPase
VSKYFEALNRRERDRRPQPADMATDEYAQLRDRLLAAGNGKLFKMLVFAGCDGGEGATQVVRECGRSLARSGLNVLLIDADLHTAALSATMDTNGGDILTAVRAGHLPPACPLGAGTLTVISSPGAAASPQHFFRTPEFAAWLDAQRSRYDFILLDAPPLLRCADTTVIARLSDGVVIVVRAEATERTVLLRARERLEHSAANAVGVVLNGARNPIPAALQPYLSDALE